MELITYSKNYDGQISVILKAPLWWWGEIRGIDSISHQIPIFFPDMYRYAEKGLDIEDFTWDDDFSRCTLDDTLKYLRICLYKWKKTDTEEDKEKAVRQFINIVPLSFLDSREICFDSQYELVEHLVHISAGGNSGEWKQYQDILEPILNEIWEDEEEQPEREEPANKSGPQF